MGSVLVLKAPAAPERKRNGFRDAQKLSSKLSGPITPPFPSVKFISRGGGGGVIDWNVNKRVLLRSADSGECGQ
jgi:hypothetical protein